MTNQEILQIAMAQSAVDLCAEPLDYPLTVTPCGRSVLTCFPHIANRELLVR